MDSGIMPTQRMMTYRLPNGDELVLYGFSMFEWNAIQDAGIAHYKRELIKTVTDNEELLPPDIYRAELRRVMDEAKAVSLDTLPRKTIKVPEFGEDDLPVFVFESSGQPVPRDAKGKLTAMEGVKLKTRDTDVDYITWWSSETLDGKLYSLWLSATKAPSQAKWTKKQVAEMVLNSVEQDSSKASNEIENAAQEVGRLSQSQILGNSPRPAEMRATSNGETKRQRRMRERREKMEVAKQHRAGS